MITGLATVASPSLLLGPVKCLAVGAAPKLEKGEFS